MTARIRLTLLYTAVAFGSGLALTALTYLLMRSRLEKRSALYLTITGGTGQPPPIPSGASDQERDATLAELLVQSAIALVAVTVLGAVVGWFVSGRVLRPIRQISVTTQRLSVDDLSARVPVGRARDELAQLATTINGMLARLETGVRSQKLFTANAAHELRTPLTTMRTAIDVTLDGEPTRAELLAMAGDIRDAVAKSQRTLDGLLALARSQSGRLSRHRVDLAEIAGTTAAAPVIGDPVLLERMVANLVENAVRHNDERGVVEVATGVQDGQSYVTVRNTGPIVDDPQRLLQPFVGGGSGLGLSIVQAVAQAHDADLTLRSRPHGGLEITFSTTTATSISTARRSSTAS